MDTLTSKIESILFAASRPVKLSELTTSLNESPDGIISALEALKKECGNRGISLVGKNERYQLVTESSNSDAVANFLNAEIREKLTDAAIETLAIIAYKQPITRAEIEAIRGVNSQYILRQLAIRGMIERTTSTTDARRAVYRTTIEFLNHLGIKDMNELPSFDELTESVSLPEAVGAVVANDDDGMGDEGEGTEKPPVTPGGDDDDTEPKVETPAVGGDEDSGE